jgi:hypothetical protein
MKKLFALVAVAAFAVAFTACGGKKVEEAAATVDSTAAAVEVVVDSAATVVDSTATDSTAAVAQ